MHSSRFVYLVAIAMLLIIGVVYFSMDLFDRAAEAAVEPAWEMAEPLPEERTEVSAATDGERIYLIGGFGPPEEEDERASAPRTMWAYTPADGSWEDLGEIPHGVHHAAFAYHDGSLYILGGFYETGFDPVEHVHVYDIEAGEWSEGASMPTPRGAAGFTLYDGGIHVIGGNVESEDAIEGMDDVQITDDNSVNVHERYDPATDSWEELAPMEVPRNHLGASGHNGRLHVVLGRADGDFTMTTHEIYDVEADSWERGPDVPTGRSGVAVVTHNGHIYTFGGENLARDDRRTFDDAERFNTDTGEWDVLPSMPTARHGLGAAVFNDGIYVISGGPGPAFTYGDANERLVLSP